MHTNRNTEQMLIFGAQMTQKRGWGGNLYQASVVISTCLPVFVYCIAALQIYTSLMEAFKSLKFSGID